MKPYVVTEGAFDAALVSRVVRDRVPTAPQVVAAGGRSSMFALAKSILVSRPSAVAVLVDADTLDREQIRAQESIFADLLRPAAQQQPFRIVQAVPQLEVVFFQTALDWNALLDAPLGLQQFAEAGVTWHPRQALEHLLRGANYSSREAFVERLDDNSVAMLAEHPVFLDLTAFLRRPTKWRMQRAA